MGTDAEDALTDAAELAVVIRDVHAQHPEANVGTDGKAEVGAGGGGTGTDRTDLGIANTRRNVRLDADARHRERHADSDCAGDLRQPAAGRRVCRTALDIDLDRHQRPSDHTEGDVSTEAR